MIKFFRKIRSQILGIPLESAEQKLLSENPPERSGSIRAGNFSKYLIYAIGEIFLVMIGILLALQVNNWNESRQQKEQIASYLQSMVDDLNNDIISLESAKSMNLFRYHSGQYLLKVANLPSINANEIIIPNWQTDNNFIWQQAIPAQYDSSFVRLAFLWSYRMGYPQFSKSSIDEMKNTGHFSQLSIDLKDAIVDYYTFALLRYGSIETYLPVKEAWEAGLRNHGLLGSNPFIYGDPIELIQSDKLLSACLRDVIQQSGWMTEGAPIMIEKAKELITLLEQNI